MLLHNHCTLVLTEDPNVEVCKVHRCGKRYRRNTDGKLEEIDRLEQNEPK